MGLQFEGIIDNIAETQLAFISDVIRKHGYTDAKVKILELGEAGDNYAANVKRIIVQNGNEELRMVAKFAPTHELFRAMHHTERIFMNEHIIYTQIFPKYQQLEEQSDVPKEDRLPFPKCYGSYTNSPNELILLEDLQVPGFKIMDRFKPLTKECIKLMLKNFAKLHSLSYALRHSEFDKFNDYSNALFDVWLNTDAATIGDLNNFITDLEDKAVMVANGEKSKKLLKGCLHRSLALTVAMKDEIFSSRHSVIVHGDAWTTNILFKFYGDSLEETVMIDYQLAKLSNPAFDLMYFILNSTEHEDRVQNFSDWIDYYHNELDKKLRYHGLKAMNVYPRDQIDIDMKKLGKIMLGVCVMLASITVMPHAEAIKVKEALETHKFEEVNQMTNHNTEFMSMFKKRIVGLIDTFEHFGFL